MQNFHQKCTFILWIDPLTLCDDGVEPGSWGRPWSCGFIVRLEIGRSGKSRSDGTSCGISTLKWQGFCNWCARTVELGPLVTVNRGKPPPWETSGGGRSRAWVGGRISLGSVDAAAIGDGEWPPCSILGGWIITRTLYQVVLSVINWFVFSLVYLSLAATDLPSSKLTDCLALLHW